MSQLSVPESIRFLSAVSINVAPFCEEMLPGGWRERGKFIPKQIVVYAMTLTATGEEIIVTIAVNDATHFGPAPQRSDAFPECNVFSVPMLSRFARVFRSDQRNSTNKEFDFIRYIGKLCSPVLHALNILDIAAGRFLHDFLRNNYKPSGEYDTEALNTVIEDRICSARTHSKGRHNDVFPCLLPTISKEVDSSIAEYMMGSIRTVVTTMLNKDIETLDLRRYSQSTSGSVDSDSDNERDKWITEVLEMAEQSEGSV
ncbi:hypothetical protein Hypma_006521 [Hypsizygus marmoreus]|uniref:Uncharacterized protein n=1 Tax=Hypsizygus marmoreus TaxID=39966 RepID=A0A369JTB7_HYPMA|nr:hypothetical protein Hypma_006521 [Hypsizygus marmoreus]